MLNKVYLSIRILKVIYGISQFNWVHSTYHRLARKLVEKITSPFDLSQLPLFPSNGRLKMQWYMAEFMYTCESFNRLMGYRSTSTQRESYFLAGALVAMCDMIIDDIEMDMDRVAILKRPTDDTFRSKDKVEELYVLCYHRFLDSLHDDIKERTIGYYELLYDAQVRSKRQFEPQLTQEEVDEICMDKCGYNLLFLRSMVQGELQMDEEKTWFELGGFIQYCNDAQDLHKDLHHQMRTFASVRNDLETISRDIQKQKTKAVFLIKETPFQKKKKDDFLLKLHVMHLGILAKLEAFSNICDLNFSFELFLSKSKAEIRSKTNAFVLLRYVLSKAIHYRYERL